MLCMLSSNKKSHPVFSIPSNYTTDDCLHHKFVAENTACKLFLREIENRLWATVSKYKLYLNKEILQFVCLPINAKAFLFQIHCVKLYFSEFVHFLIHLQKLKKNISNPLFVSEHLYSYQYRLNIMFSSRPRLSAVCIHSPFI